MRTSSLGYSVPDSNRQKYAMLERDSTGLDHTWWRKYESTAGRWTSPDPLRGSVGNPQSFNAYGYAGNDPVNLVDPSGLWADASNGEGAGCRLDGIPVNCGMAFSLINMGAAYIRSGAGFYLEGRVLIFDRITRDFAGYTYWNAFLMDPQNAAPSPNPNCIRNAVAGSIGTSRGIIPAVGPNGPTGLAVHDGDHVLSGPGGPAAVTTLGPLAGTVLGTGNQGDGLHYADVRLNSSIAGAAYNVRYKDLLTVGVAVGNRLGAGSSIGTVRPAGDPRNEIGLHVTLVQRSEYAGYVNRVRKGQYSPIGIFMGAVSDPRSPVRCP